jgi:hypothetical protein
VGRYSLLFSVVFNQSALLISLLCTDVVQVEDVGL